MELIHNGRYLKLIPKAFDDVDALIKANPEKFEGIESVADLLEDEEYKRLTKSERASLNAVLLKPMLDNFIKEYKKNYLYKDLLKRARFKRICKINAPRKKSYYVVQFTNGIELRCPREFYSASEVKQVINRSY